VLNLQKNIIENKDITFHQILHVIVDNL
jgi:hypothetical protein